MTNSSHFLLLLPGQGATEDEGHPTRLGESTQPAVLPPAACFHLQTPLRQVHFIFQAPKERLVGTDLCLLGGCKHNVDP